VGNTITEIARECMPKGVRDRNYLVGDIHRSENLKTPQQLHHILKYLNAMGDALGLPVKLVKFARAQKMIEEGNLLKGLNRIEVVGPYGFLKYLEFQYKAYAVISDSGTAQEECPLLGVPAIVPRNRTERPESVENGNSILIGETGSIDQMVSDSLKFLKSYSVTPKQIEWLGDGKTAQHIIDILKEKLKPSA
jgi:UDP-N-acetylglucosamine 2-epimerase (non-hydrolysing)